MTAVRIADIADVVRGVSWDKSEASDAPREGYLPILRAGNIGDVLTTDDDLVWVPSSNVSAIQSIRAGDIAICMSSGSASVVGKTAFAKTDWPGSVGAFCALLRADANQCLPEYLGFYLKSPKFRRWTSEAQGANIKNIRKSALEDFAISLPPLPEQRRIVDLLSRADGIVRLRREAQRKAAELIPAIFLDMFGDPATNPKAWPVANLDELVIDGPQNGLYKHGSLYGDGTPILRIDAFYDGRVRDLKLLKRVRITAEECAKFGLRSRDIIINRVNSIEYLGKSAIVPQLDEETVFESNMMRFSVDETHVLPEYVIELLQTSHAKSHFLAKAKRAINQASINQQDVKSLSVPVPPLKRQNDFSERVEQVHSIKIQQTAATAKAEATFAALLAQAFSTAT